MDTITLTDLMQQRDTWRNLAALYRTIPDAENALVCKARANALQSRINAAGPEFYGLYNAAELGSEAA